MSERAVETRTFASPINTQTHTETDTEKRRRTRRMILPERVLGKAGVQTTMSGVAKAPMASRTAILSDVSSWGDSISPSRSVTKQQMPSPFTWCG